MCLDLARIGRRRHGIGGGVSLAGSPVLASPRASCPATLRPHSKDLPTPHSGDHSGRRTSRIAATLIYRPRMTRPGCTFLNSRRTNSKGTPFW
jgi:hypothetical protein